MFDKMKQMMEFKKQAEQIKKDLEATEVEVRDVPGIAVIVNGAQDFRSIEIDPDRLQAGEKARLEQDLLQAVNKAVKKSQELATKKMSSMIPSGFGF